MPRSSDGMGFTCFKTGAASYPPAVAMSTTNASLL
jgi:hypothetical protein